MQTLKASLPAYYGKRESDCQPVFNNAGKPVGEIRNGWLVKTGLDPQLHQLRQPPAWATDEEHLRLLEGIGGRGVRLVTLDGATWEATLETFRERGIPFDRGHGPQVALPLKRWTVHHPGARQLALPMEVG